MRLFLLSALLAGCAGFGPATQIPRSAVALRRSTLLMEAEAPVKEEEATEAAVEEEAPPAVEYAASLPFLVKRPQLKGYVGDVGFDPLGFTEILPVVRCAPPPPPEQLCRVPPDLLSTLPSDVGADVPLPLVCQEWLREAEIKHCRVAMLAFVRQRPALASGGSVGDGEARQGRGDGGRGCGVSAAWTINGGPAAPGHLI